MIVFVFLILVDLGQFMDETEMANQLSFLNRLFKDESEQSKIDENTQEIIETKAATSDREIVDGIDGLDKPADDFPEVGELPRGQCVKDSSAIMGRRKFIYELGASGITVGTVGLAGATLIVDHALTRYSDRLKNKAISPHFVHQMEANFRNLNTANLTASTDGERDLLQYVRDFSNLMPFNSAADARLSELEKANEEPLVKAKIVQFRASYQTRMGYAQDAYRRLSQISEDMFSQLSNDDKLRLDAERVMQMFVSQKASDWDNPSEWGKHGGAKSNFVKELDRLNAYFFVDLGVFKTGLPNASEQKTLFTDLRNYGAPLLHMIYYNTAVRAVLGGDQNERRMAIDDQIRLFKIILGNRSEKGFPNFERQVWMYLVTMYVMCWRSHDEEYRKKIYKILVFESNDLELTADLRASIFQKGRTADHMQQFFIINANAVELSKNDGKVLSGEPGQLLYNHLENIDQVQNQRCRAALYRIGKQVEYDFGDGGSVVTASFNRSADAFEGYLTH